MQGRPPARIGSDDVVDVYTVYVASYLNQGLPTLDATKSVSLSIDAEVMQVNIW
jgi:hypothetical protein